MTAPIHAARRGTLLLFILTHIALVTVINLLLFPQGAFRPLAQATGGLINGTLVVGIALLCIIVGLVCLRYGRLRTYDIGWIPGHIASGAGFTVALWAAAQIVHLGAGWAASGVVRLSPGFAADSVSTTIGLLIGHLLGNALFEELAYRGFLFPQLYLRIHGSGERPWVRFLFTLLLSQAIFALVHIPNRVYLGMSSADIARDLALLTGWGVLFTLLYLNSDNIFLVAGVHALGNAPTTLFATAPGLSGDGETLLIFLLAALAVFVFPALARRLRARMRPALSVRPAEAWANEN
jgi:hypothetical protein